MNTNFFELIDGVFQGTILFVYNIITTTANLFRYPLSGPHQLYRRHHNKLERQMAPWTFLVLSFLFTFSLLPAWFDQSNLDRILEETPSYLLGHDASTILPMLIGSITAAVLIDLLLRLVVWIRWRTRPIWYRDLLVGTLVFAAAAAPIVTILSIRAVGLARFIHEPSRQGFADPV
jgi:hypothetical protein